MNVNLTLVMQVDEIDYVVEAEVGLDDYVDLRVVRADGEDYEESDAVMQAAIEAVGYVIINDVEAEIIH